MWSGNLTRPCCHLRSELQYTSRTAMKTQMMSIHLHVQRLLLCCTVQSCSWLVVGLLTSLSALLIWCLNDEVIPLTKFKCNRLHLTFPGAPCLSFDVLRDTEGEGRETFPQSMLLCAGTQADTALSNRSVHFFDRQIKKPYARHGWH